MKSRMIVVWSLLCATLLLFTACGVAFQAPDVKDRPQASQSGTDELGFEPPTSQSVVTATTEMAEKQPPAYWRGQSHTLPGTETVPQSTASTEASPSASDSTGSDEPQQSATSAQGGTEEPPQQSSSVTTTEPIYTTATTPDPKGEGRGDAFEVTEKSGNGTKEVQCTPFY